MTKYRVINYTLVVLAILAAITVLNPALAQSANPFTLFSFGASVDTNAGATGANTLRVLANQGAAGATGWKVDGTGGTFPVTGTFWQATQPISATALPLPTGASTESTLGNVLTTSDFDTKTGALTETAPATDTASSGLNGRLQRVAQRLSSLIALLPTALGTGGGLKVDGSGTALPVSGTFFQSTQPISISDGSDNTLGAQADAAVVTSASGTVSAKLRGIVSLLVSGITVATHAVTQSGTWTVRVVGNAGAIFDGATGAAPPANGVYHVGLGSGATGGLLIGFTVGDTSKSINISTATTTLIITGVASRQVHIAAFHMITTLANNVAWIEGTGATCGTGSAGMAGGTTAASGYNLAANGGIAQGSGLGDVLTTVTAGDSVCLVTSAATQLSGHARYAIY